MWAFLASSDRKDQETPPVPASLDVLYIPPGTEIDGPIHTAQSVWVEGTVNGDICTEDEIVVSEEATIYGAVRARSADVGGAVEGGLEVSGPLILEATARVQGQLAADELTVEEGARFSGDCRMDAPDRRAEPEGGSHGKGAQTQQVAFEAVLGS